MIPLFFCGVSKAEPLVTVNINSPVNNSQLTGSPVITGTASVEGLVFIYIDGIIDGVAPVSEDGFWTYDAPNLSLGSHTIRAVWLDNAFAYVSNYGSGTVSVIFTLLDVPLGSMPIDENAQLSDVVLLPDHSKAYVLDASPINNGFWVINISGVIDVTPRSSGGNHPFAIDDSPSGDHVYIINQDSANMGVIDTTDDSLEGTYTINDLLDAPMDIAVSPAGGVAYIANATETGGEIVVANLSDYSGTTIATTCELPNAVVFNPAGTLAYVAEGCGESYGHGGVVDVIDVATQEIISTVDLDGSAKGLPQSIAITPDGSKVLAVDNDTNKVWIINTADLNDVVGLSVGNIPMSVAVNYNGEKAYVTNFADNSVSVINLTNDSVNPIPIMVGLAPMGLGMLEDYYFSNTVAFNIVSPPQTTAVITNQTNNTSNPGNNLSDPTPTPTPTPEVTPTPTIVNSQNNSQDPPANDNKGFDYLKWGGFTLLALIGVYIIYIIFRRLT